MRAADAHHGHPRRCVGDEEALDVYDFYERKRYQ